MDDAVPCAASANAITEEGGIIVKVNPTRNNAVANSCERGEDDNGFLLDRIERSALTDLFYFLWKLFLPLHCYYLSSLQYLDNELSYNLNSRTFKTTEKGLRFLKIYNQISDGMKTHRQLYHDQLFLH